MATLQQIGNFWTTNSGTLYEKFLGGCLKSAYDVINEDGGTVNHANRLAWAQVILTGTDDAVKTKVTQMLRYALASNVNIQTNLEASPDNDILFVIASQLNALNP